MRKGGFRNQTKKRLMSEINVVPYVDVTLVLLIIFMVTAPIVQQAVTVDLPVTPVLKQKDDNNQYVQPFVISITKEGLYKTNEAPHILLGEKDMGQLLAEVVARSQLDPTKPFYIQADKMAEYGKVVHLFTLLKANGVEQVSLLTKPEAP